MLRTLTFASAAVAASALDEEREFQLFKDAYGKNYNGDEERRFEIFKSNLRFIEETNAKNLSYTLGVNQFADLTTAEVVAGFTGLKPAALWAGHQHLGTHSYGGQPLGDAVDWVAKGAVTPVKDQGQCGSCWSFSTTGALEGAWKISQGTLVPLSEQQFVDCDKVDSGCQGGLMDQGFDFAKDNAICTETSYPYKARGGSCQESSCTVGIPKGGVTGYKDVASDNLQAMMSAVAQQPVSIAIEADKPAFQSYKSGILDQNCGTQLDHGVLLVGYGTDGKDYWKVKNSWGSSWGEQGYIRLVRGKGGAGECGLLQQASYPVVDGSAPPAPPTPPVPPTPPAPSSGHYGAPPCQSDEQQFEIQGLTGTGCFPQCSSGECPTDVPAGTTAKPVCKLQDQSGNQYCALQCFELNPGCPEGATCQGGTGVEAAEAARRKAEQDADDQKKEYCAAEFDAAEDKKKKGSLFFVEE